MSWIELRHEALVFDVDGTLYHQGMLRRRMLWRLLRTYARQPLQGWRTARILSEYRREQERLRNCSDAGGDLSLRQLRLVAETLGTDVAAVAPVIHRWMEREPLPFLPSCTPRSLKPLLEIARERGMKLGVVSDYPAQHKLAALGLEAFFPVVVCAQDADVQTFKPDPRGLQLVLRRLGVANRDALYIGDRADVDVATARNADVPCLILGRKRQVRPEGWLEVAGYRDLRQMLFHE
jgi:FMN phosphatase YigB (HAD superfamily)